MRIYEYESKQLLAKAGIPVPRGIVVDSPAQAAAAASELAAPVVIKPQTLAKARGKAGLIAFAAAPKEAESAAAGLLGRVHQEETIRQLLVEEKVAIQRELYLGIVVDYTHARPLVLASPAGGVDIEETAARTPEMIRRLPVSISAGLQAGEAREVAGFLLGEAAAVGNPSLFTQVESIVSALYQVFRQRDCEMVEINPLAVTSAAQAVAVDGAAVIDDDSLWRQEDLLRPRNQNLEEFQREQDFRARGWSYLKLDGNIGILSSGAGITMAILDLMRLHGGRPANFLDTAQMDRQGIYDAFKIFLDDPAIKTVLVNIFAGLNRCDHLAEGISDFLRDCQPGFQVVVRMVGNREEEGRKIMRAIGIDPISELEEAVIKAIELTEGPQ